MFKFSVDVAGGPPRFIEPENMLTCANNSDVHKNEIIVMRARILTVRFIVICPFDINNQLKVNKAYEAIYNCKKCDVPHYAAAQK